jgi:hypothetical protein
MQPCIFQMVCDQGQFASSSFTPVFWEKLARRWITNFPGTLWQIIVRVVLKCRKFLQQVTATGEVVRVLKDISSFSEIVVVKFNRSSSVSILTDYGRFQFSVLREWLFSIASAVSYQRENFLALNDVPLFFQVQRARLYLLGDIDKSSYDAFCWAE